MKCMSTASVVANRVTVCLTWEQKRFIQNGSQRFRIGFSEYLRRVLDEHIYGDAVGITASVSRG